MQNRTPLWKKAWQLLTKLSIFLPYDPANVLFGTYPMSTQNPHTDVNRSFIYKFQNNQDVPQ
jgi:hypothetical protein